MVLFEKNLLCILWNSIDLFLSEPSQQPEETVDSALLAEENPALNPPPVTKASNLPPKKKAKTKMVTKQNVSSFVPSLVC